MSLKAKIADKSAVVGVIGLGYVGLPLARAFCVSGLRVIGFDVDREVVVLRSGDDPEQERRAVDDGAVVPRVDPRRLPAAVAGLLP